MYISEHMIEKAVHGRARMNIWENNRAKQGWPVPVCWSVALQHRGGVSSQRPYWNALVSVGCVEQLRFVIPA